MKWIAGKGSFNATFFVRLATSRVALRNFLGSRNFDHNKRAKMVQECEVCGFVGDFDVRDGLFYCSQCQTQSQEMGRETQVS